jgi:hypothetical protein
MRSVAFGGERFERLAIAVNGYENSDRTGDYHDDNWLTAEISIAVGAFRGKCHANFQVAELLGLHAELQSLQKSLKGQVTFEPLEGQLNLRFTGNGYGGIELKGRALDQPGIGNALDFTLQLDQSQLSTSIGQMNELLAKFPVRDV